VVFITSHSTWDRITEAIESGASDFLIKPVDQEDLVNVAMQLGTRWNRWRSAVSDTLRGVAALA
jgi:DNA-binding NtrC family response regulator